MRRRLLVWPAAALAGLLALGGGVVLRGPDAAVRALRGAPRALVRGEALPRGPRLLESLALTTSGGLEVRLLVDRPAEGAPAVTLLCLADAEDALDLGAALPAGAALAALTLEPVSDSGLLAERRAVERRAAAYLAVHDFLRAQPWAAEGPTRFVGWGDSAAAATLAARLAGRPEDARVLAPPAPVAGGLRARLRRLLAHTGRRAPAEPVAGAPGPTPAALGALASSATLR